MTNQEKTPVAIVTAASQGMGKAIAEELARKGYNLVLLARSDSVLALAEQLGGVAVQGSVSVVGDLERVVAIAQARFGRIDAVINNTGHPARGDLLAIPDDDWHSALDLLVLNVVRMSRLVTPIMGQAGGGAFVNISTIGATEPDLKFPLSTVLRAGLGGFAKMYAQRYGAAGIRMNNILPGAIDSWPQTQERIDQIPAKRLGKVSEIAHMAAFLVSDEAAYVNGQSILVDGGLAHGA